MANENNYFGANLGQAIAAGAGSIASGLQRKYEMQRENAIRQEALSKAEEEKDIAKTEKYAGAGIKYDPANPVAALDAFIEMNKAKASRDIGDEELKRKKMLADIKYTESLPGMFGGTPQSGLGGLGKIVEEGGIKYLVTPGGKGQPPRLQAMGTPQSVTQEDELRKEISGLSKQYVEIKDSFERVKASNSNPSPAGDLALIFNYMKMLDPGSTVREGEFATAATSGSYGDIFKAAANKIVSGERLSDDMRSDFVNRAAMLYDAKLKTHQNLLKDYEGIASRRGLKTENVISPNLRGITPPPNLVETKMRNKKTGQIGVFINGELVRTE